MWGFGGSYVWFVDICVSAGVVSAYEIIFGIDSGADKGFLMDYLMVQMMENLRVHC